MKTKILYVLVSSPSDIYLEQAYISISSLRHHMGQMAVIVLLIDNKTKSTLFGERTRIVDLVDEVICVDIDFRFTPQQRSRILKTSARNKVDGDFLFIDCDTLILKPLEDIDNYKSEIAAVRDSHCDFMHNPYREMCLTHTHKISNDIFEFETYFNSGVLLVKDTSVTRNFYRKWHENWINGCKVGVNMDQPSFNLTNLRFGKLVKALPDTWNCQYIHGVKYLNNAYILHYLCTNNLVENDTASFILRDKKTLNNLKNNLVIPSDIKDCFDDPFNGIPNLTHIHAGISVEIFNTSQYKVFLELYNSKYFKVYSMIGRILKKLKQIF